MASLKQSLKKLRRRLFGFLRRRPRGTEHERTPAIRLDELLGDESLAPWWKKPLDLPALLARHGISPRGVIHLGAHQGNELDTYLALGCSPIVLVDANPAMIPVIRAKAAGRPGVHVVHAAISDKEGPITLHITNAEQSSSILPLGKHKAYYPKIREERAVVVPGKTIDGMLEELGLAAEQFNLLVMDIQGAEFRALKGAARTLPSIEAVLTEYSVVELYEGCALLGDLEDFLAGSGLSRASDCAPWHPTWGDAFYIRRPVVAMSTLGANGRFANQLFQYLFLATVARRNDAIVQVPDWAGAHLYGLADPPPLRALPRFDETDPTETTAARIRAASAESLLARNPDAVGVDYKGYFQFDSAALAPLRADARRLFTPIPAVASRVQESIARLRGEGRRIVVVHLRRGDYGYDCFFRAPCAWYEEWIRRQSLDPARTVVYIASEEPGTYRRRFDPLPTATARDISTLPPALDWFVDFEVMRAADSLAISNSSFSFMAAFLNERIARAARPCTDAMRLVDFDPADAPVLLRKVVPSSLHQQLAALDRR
ncbi:MAG: hypothetical protein RL325_97 [Planctomycetota bacterium]